MDSQTLLQELGASIRKRREALELSQDSFADKIKMHRAYYSAIERGERNVTLATLARVSTGLGAPMWELIQLAEDPSRPRKRP